MTFARLILSSSLNVERPPKTKSDHLPSRPAAMALVQFYLDNVHSLYPAFPETALFTAVDAIYQGGRPVSDFEHWLLYMVLAIGATGQSRSMNDAYYKDGVSWLARALRYSDSVLVPGFVTQMQALVLLVQYSMLDPVHFDSWQLIGFACRALVDLGYHQDPPKESQPDKQALDQRRKLFWCIYALDRYNQALTGSRHNADRIQISEHGSCSTILIYRRCHQCGLARTSCHCTSCRLGQSFAGAPSNSHRLPLLSTPPRTVQLVPRALSISACGVSGFIAVFVADMPRHETMGRELP